jgi:DDE superfamily endonuclease
MIKTSSQIIAVVCHYLQPPQGSTTICTDNLSSHSSAQTRAWMAKHPRLHHVFIPTGAYWLNLQEGWWRLFRRDGLAGQSFANADEMEQATRITIAQLNRRANPWVWGRPPKDHRHYRRLFSYRL